MSIIQQRELAFMQDHFTALATLMLSAASESRGDFRHAEGAIGALIRSLRAPRAESALLTSVASADRAYACPDAVLLGVGRGLARYPVLRAVLRSCSPRRARCR